MVFVLKTEPLGYKVVEYIKSDGTNYINTQYVPKSKNRVILDISIFPMETTSSDNFKIFGSGSYGFSAIAMNINYTQTVFFKSGDGDSIKLYKSDIPNILDRHLWQIDFSYFDSGNATPTLIYMDGILKSNVNRTFNNNFNTKVPIKIMQIGEGQTGMGIVTLYSYKHYDSYNENSLVLDLVPAINPSGIAGVYDRVSGKFFNQEIGNNFIAGPRTGEIIAQ